MLVAISTVLWSFYSPNAFMSTHTAKEKKNDKQEVFRMIVL